MILPFKVINLRKHTDNTILFTIYTVINYDYPDNLVLKIRKIQKFFFKTQK